MLIRPVFDQDVSGKELLDNVAFDVGEAKVAAGVAVGQAFVVQAQGVQ
jgi:hypothetical protein